MDYIRKDDDFEKTQNNVTYDALSYDDNATDDSFNNAENQSDEAEEIEKIYDTEETEEIEETDETEEIEEIEEIEENHDKQNKIFKNSLYKKYKQSKNNFVIFCLIFALLLSVLFTPIFNIKEITVTGNNKITRDAILQKGDLYTGVNILKADVSGAANKIATMPFVYSVEVKRVFPAKIEVIVEECVEVAYISYMGNYVGISSFGKILEISNKQINESIPVVNGIEIKNAQIGEMIEIDDESKKDVLMQYLSSLENNIMLPSIKNIDFTNINDVKLVLDSEILVKLGQVDKISYKLAYLEKVYSQLDGQRGGILDLTNPEKSVVYKAS